MYTHCTTHASSVSTQPAFNTLLLIAVIALAASHADAIGRDNITLYSPLDGSADASLAAGSPDVLPGLHAVYAPGMRGQALVVDKDAWDDPSLCDTPRVRLTKDIDIYHDYGGPDTIGALRYDATNNITSPEGTLAFWMKPVNWQSQGRDQFLVNLGSKDSLALYYSPYWAYEVFQVFKDTENYVRLHGFDIGAFIKPQGVWQHIVLSWSDHALAWWQNGVLAKRQDQSIIPITDTTGQLAFGAGEDYQTAFDDVVALNRMVSDEEARALYYKLAQKADAGVITLALDNPNIIDFTGWNDSILGLVNDDTMRVQITSDGQALNVRWEWPFPEKFFIDRDVYVAQPLDMQGRNDHPSIFEDDYVAITLRPGDAEPVYRFAANAAEKRYDDRDGDRSWDARWTIHSDMREDRWIMDCRIPFEAVGSRPKAGDVWAINFTHGASRVQNLESVWSYGGPSVPDLGTLRFVEQAPDVRVDLWQDGRDGQVTLSGSMAGLDGTYTLQASATSTSNAELRPRDDPFAKLDATAPTPWHDQTRLIIQQQQPQSFSLAGSLAEVMAADLAFQVRDDADKVVYYQRTPFVYSILWNTDVSFLPSQDRLLVTADAGSSQAVDSLKAIRVRVTDKQDKTIADKTISPVRQARTVVELPTKDMPVGDYQVSTTFVRDKITGADTLVDLFTKPEDPVWLDSNVGVIDYVPEPWTPLHRDADRIRCWGREYDFTNSFFPAGVEVLNEDILASPMRLTMKYNGKQSHLVPDTVRWTSTTDRKISWQAVCKKEGLQVVLDGWIEFDGFMWLALSMSGEGDVEGLSLEIPFKSTYATHWYSGQYAPQNNDSGYIPKEGWKGQLRNYVIIGNGTRSLQWCYESQQGWSQQSSRRGLELLPDDEVMLARLTCIDKPVQMTSSPRTISLGLQALPVRPDPMKNMRHVYWAGWSGTYHSHPNISRVKTPDMSVSFSAGYETWPMPLHNYPRLTEERFEQVLERVRKDYLEYNHFCTYKHFDLSTTGRSPEYRTYGEEWRAWPAPKPDFDRLDANPNVRSWERICYGADSYLDFYTYYVRQYMTRLRDGGKLPVLIYMDVTGPARCANPHHGHGWIDDNGIRQSTLAIRSQRAYMQRLHQIFAELGDDCYITVHMSGRPLMAIWGYADLLLPGEQYAAFFKQLRGKLDAAGEPCPASYIPFLTMDDFRAEFMPATHGVACGFLDQLYQMRNKEEVDLMRKGYKKVGREQARKDPAYNVLLEPEWQRGRRHFADMCVVHDCFPWGGDHDVTVALRNKFGWDDNVTFYGYWDNHNVCSLDIYDEQQYVVSLARRPERLAILAFNNTDRDVQGTITVDLAGLDLPQLADATLVDLLTGEAVDHAGGTFTCTMPARKLRVLCLGPTVDR